jgi:hypothetical protein
MREIMGGAVERRKSLQHFLRVSNLVKAFVGKKEGKYQNLLSNMIVISLKGAAAPSIHFRPLSPDWRDSRL